VIFRHYGHKDRAMLATRLAALCRRRRLVFCVAGDWRLAARVGAAGLHLPEYLARQGAAAGARLWRKARRRLLTVRRAMPRTCAARGRSRLRPRFFRRFFRRQVTPTDRRSASCAPPFWSAA